MVFSLLVVRQKFNLSLICHQMFKLFLIAICNFGHVCLYWKDRVIRFGIMSIYPFLALLSDLMLNVGHLEELKSMY